MDSCAEILPEILAATVKRVDGYRIHTSGCNRMPELVRDSSHSNGISILHLENAGIFRKISRSKQGRNLLHNESAGINWYRHARGDSDSLLSSTLWETDTFTRLDIKRIEGFQALYTDSVSVNQGLLEACLAHYLDTWPRQSRVPCHGDLTLDNVIFLEKNDPVFFDWEHFSGHGECWGFDMAYLLLSAIVLPAPHRSDITVIEKDTFVALWRQLAEAGLPEELGKNPAGFFRQAFSSGKHWLEITAHSPHKLFPLWMSKEQESHISHVIVEGIN